MIEFECIYDTFRSHLLLSRQVLRKWVIYANIIQRIQLDFPRTSLRRDGIGFADVTGSAMQRLPSNNFKWIKNIWEVHWHEIILCLRLLEGKYEIKLLTKAQHRIEILKLLWLVRSQRKMGGESVSCHAEQNDIVEYLIPPPDFPSSLRGCQSNFIICCHKPNNNAPFRALFNLNILMTPTICNAFQIDVNISIRIQIRRGVALD